MTIHHAKFVTRHSSFAIRRGLILLVTLLAFGLRLRALTRFQYHIDEFFTLTAADLIAKTGLPRYPTGLFYDPGLPFSYLDGALFWLLGYNEALGRWPAVIFGTLAVVTVYGLGARLLRSPAVGLLAALWLSLSLESVEWGGRARMITLAQWLALLSVGLLWVGLKRDSARHRLGFALSYGVTLVTHFSTVVLMPAWFVAAAALWGRNRLRLHRALLRDALVALLVFGLALTSGVIFQPPPTVEFQTSQAGLETKTGLLTNKFLQIPSDVGHAWEAYGPYFVDLPHGPLLALALLGLGVSLRRAGHGDRCDAGALFLGAIFLTAMLTLSLVIAPHWQRARYLLMQLQGIFLLLGAHGCRELLLWLRHLPGWGVRQSIGPEQNRPAGRVPAKPNPRIYLRYRLGQAGLALLLTAGLSLPFLPPLKNIIDSDSDGWNRYDLAFKHARRQMSTGEKIMSMHPPASLLYLNQSDYYLVQSSPKLIVRPDGALGDRYTGAIWLDTAAEFNTLLQESDGRVWLVTQEFWLFHSYSGILQQQILQQMDKLWGEGGVWALASKLDSWPLAESAETRLDAQFQGGTRLQGYTLHPARPAPGAAMRVTLFWQGAIPYGAKVFVHLRDIDNNTVAQADHFIYDGKVPTSRWPALQQNDTVIRDGATLLLPPDLQPGRYRLLVGFYHPETFERLGVVDDQTGESGVILNEWVIE